MSVTLEKPAESTLLEKASNGNGQEYLTAQIPARSRPAELLNEPHTLALTREMVATLEDAGHLNGLRYELIHGRIVVHMPTSGYHSHVVIRLILWLARFFDSGHIHDQSTINVRREDNRINQPEPDVAIVSQPVHTYGRGYPPSSDILFAVEVSLTTLDFDTEEKAQLYARAGIADYWVVDIENRQVIVFREPTDEGYSSTTPYAETETVAPLAKPEAGVLVGELLPPAEE